MKCHLKKIMNKSKVCLYISFDKKLLSKEMLLKH